MRIGIDARLWNETGVGRYIRSLFRYLSECDQENEYVWFVRKVDHQNIKDQISRLRQGFGGQANLKWEVVIGDVRWHTFAEQLVLPWIFARKKLDLLHFPYFSFPILYPGKFVVTIHDLIFDHYKTGKTSTLPSWLYAVKKAGYHTVLWTSVRRAEKVLTLSNDSKNEIVNHYHIDPNKIVVTYESGELEDVRKKFEGKEFEKIKKLAPYLLYVGNAHPHKNVETLILAMQEVRKKFPNMKLVLVGNDPFFYPKLEEFTHKKRFTDTVKIIGSVPNNQIAAWYHFAEALVTASKMEGFGIPPLEAMSMGCPAMVSDISVFHEVYADAAVYFDQNDPENISQVVVKTLGNKALVEELVKRGYERSKIYSWEKTVRETLEAYKKC